MIGENDEKTKLVLKVCLIIITYIIIGLCGLFFILVSKVNAATTIYTYNDNLQVLTQCNNTTECNNMTLNGAISGAYEFKENVSLVNNTTTTINITYRTKYGLKNYIVNEINPYVYLTNGVGSVDITNSCTIDGTRSQRTDNFGITFVDYNWTISCVINITTTDSNQIGVARAIKLTEESGSKYFTMSLFEDNVSLTSTPSGNDVADAINSGNANIINNQNNNTNNIISNNNSNADRIIDSNNTSAQSVINADNYNTDRTIEAIEKQNTKCDNYNFNNDIPTDNSLDGKKLNTNGTTTNVNGYKISQYLKITANKNYQYTTSNIASNNTYCIYGEDKSLISCSNAVVNGTTIINSSVDGYLRLSIRLNYTNNLSGEFCFNIQDKQAEEQQKQNDYLMDNTPADYNIISGIQATPDTPISSLLTMPIRLIQAFLDNINGQCADYTFGSLYGTTLQLKCSDIRNIPRYLGSAYEVIDYFMCFFMIYNIFMLLIHAYETITTLKDDFANIYETKVYGNGKGFDY